jgi:hypothetical protein
MTRDYCSGRLAWNATDGFTVSTNVTEQQKYRVTARFDHVELRHYEPCVVADIVVIGTQEQAGNSAFRPLVSYISGANRTATRLAMTAPVVQEAASERLAMTAPVLQERASSDASWRVSFVLPGARAIEDYPEPTDHRIVLRAVDGHDAAAIRWSGRWTSGNVAARTEELNQEIARQGWTVTGQPRWARYDPPWKPPFARRNEIVVPVAPVRAT